ncbi:hypothetical protein ASF78_06300 [Cellulomonas sp. Leaf334]|nr:hypothetical protein ASF78_06300 [Cellulomonas sp. Leaf334]
MLVAGVLAGCGAGVADAGETPDLVLTSPDLDDAGTLPAWATGVYGTTCAGDNRSPALAWDGVPDGTRSFVVTFTDPAHPSYVHWVVTGIDPSATGLDSADDGMVDGGIVGDSFRGTGSYGGPCVEGNQYVYTVYALDEEISGTARTTLGDVLVQMDGHILDQAELEVLRAAS